MVPWAPVQPQSPLASKNTTSRPIGRPCFWLGTRRAWEVLCSLSCLVLSALAPMVTKNRWVYFVCAQGGVYFCATLKTKLNSPYVIALHSPEGTLRALARNGNQSNPRRHSPQPQRQSRQLCLAARRAHGDRRRPLFHRYRAVNCPRRWQYLKTIVVTAAPRSAA